MAGEPSKPSKNDPSSSKPSSSRPSEYSTYYFALALAHMRGDPDLYDDSSSSSESDSDASIEDWSAWNEALFGEPPAAPDRVPLPGEAGNPILIDDDEPLSDNEEPEVIDPEVPPCGHCEGCMAHADCVANGIPPPI